MFLNMSLLVTFILFIFSMMFFFFSILFLYYNLVMFIEWNLIMLNSSNIVFTMLLDWMSLIFMGLVMFISSMVIFYSKSYMFTEINFNRFILLVLMFVISMMFMIISPNLISILLGWDGLGLVSYCLVIFYQNYKSFNSGMLTVLSNRVGDIFLLMSIAWMMNYGSWNYIFYMDLMKNMMEMNFISFLVFIAAITKSAQVPFSSWLPAAMAAPTPVSSLVHSSTLVTAGVYLMVRFFNVLSYNLLVLMMVISLLTMMVSGMGAMMEFDLKKIIALSTLSQLGLMLFTLSMELNLLTFFHLLTHAMFKALLFMCAGLMIHNLKNIQDIRFMGSLGNQLPLTSLCFCFSNLALCGFPFLAGFYSKDMILELYFMKNYNMFIMVMFMFVTLLTVMYTFRLIYYIMISEFNLTSLNLISYEDKVMIFSMFNMLILSVVGGSMLMWMIFYSMELICLTFFMKILPLLIIVMGLIIGVNFYKMNFYKYMHNMKFYFIMDFFSSMWFLPIMSTNMISFYSLNLSYLYSLKLDFGWSEMFGGQGLSKFLIKNSKFMEWFNYNGIMVFVILFLFIYLLLLILLI